MDRPAGESGLPPPHLQGDYTGSVLSIQIGDCPLATGGGPYRVQRAEWLTQAAYPCSPDSAAGCSEEQE